METIHTQSQKLNKGFTLIEMIVSLGIFSVVMTIAVGSLLVLIYNNQKLQGEQSVMTNLAFALDGMTREIRTGTNYYCDSRANLTGGGSSNYFRDGTSQETEIGNSTRDCTVIPGGHRVHGISFYEGGDSITTSASNRILYYYDRDSSTIKRRVGDGASQSIVASGLELIDARFYVTGTSPLPDTEQPTVTIYIEAKETGDDKIYRLQTTVTQRILDL